MEARVQIMWCKNTPTMRNNSSYDGRNGRPIITLSRDGVVRSLSSLSSRTLPSLFPHQQNMSACYAPINVNRQYTFYERRVGMLRN